MPNPLQLRCNQLERSMRALHDECERLMRENAMLRERMQGYGAGQTIHRIDDELSRIAAGPDAASASPHVFHVPPMRQY